VPASALVVSGKPKLVLCFITYCKIVCTSRSKFIDDSLYQKLLILVQLCWRYLKISHVSGFLRHSIRQWCSLEWSYNAGYRHVHEVHLSCCGNVPRFPTLKLFPSWSRALPARVQVHTSRRWLPAQRVALPSSQKTWRSRRRSRVQGRAYVTTNRRLRRCHWQPQRAAAAAAWVSNDDVTSMWWQPVYDRRRGQSFQAPCRQRHEWVNRNQRLSRGSSRHPAGLLQ